MFSDRSVSRAFANVFQDITIMGDRIRDRLVSWNNIFMSVGFRRERMRQAKRLLVSLNEALTTLKPNL